MYHWMDSGDWFWMTFMTVFGVVLLGAVVYVAVNLANRPPTRPEKSRLSKRFPTVSGDQR
jgi:hypothetical protein